jgi:hypothetical protein
MKTNFKNLRDKCCIGSVVALVLGLFSAPLTNAAVIGHWTFNEDGGTTAIDSSGQNNHGTINGGAPYVASPGGAAISLDGVDDNVNFGQPAILDFTDEDFTIEIWVAIDASQSTSEYVIFGKHPFGVDPDASWQMGYVHGSAKHNIQLCGPSGCGIVREAFDPSATPFGTYRHVVFEREFGSGSAFYIDGQVDGEGGGTGLIYSQMVDVVAGGTDSGTAKLKCMIDEIKVHDVRLGEIAVSNSFAAGASTAPSPIPASSEVLVGNVLSTEFSSRELARYELECTEDLVTPNWTNSSTAFVIGTGANMFMSDSTGISTNKLYRLTVQ